MQMVKKKLKVNKVNNKTTDQASGLLRTCFTSGVSVLERGHGHITYPLVKMTSRVAYWKRILGSHV